MEDRQATEQRDEDSKSAEDIAVHGTSAPAQHAKGSYIAQADRGGSASVAVTTITQDLAYDVHGLPSPYLGLRSFTYDERERYAGRDAAIRAAVALLTDPGAERVLLFITGCVWLATPWTTTPLACLSE